MLGYVSMWSNDHPSANGLDTLATFARSVPGIDLGVAVMALDRRAPDIARRIEELGLPPDRLWVGVGAGFSGAALTRMRELRGCARRFPTSGWCSPRWVRRCAASLGPDTTARSSTG